MTDGLTGRADRPGNGDFHLACLRAANPALAVLRPTNDAPTRWPISPYAGSCRPTRRPTR
ncbi:hypothetical protein [Actinopolymorpha rutila]|uniref:Uncharacterized protein n=1 Tax=Actinopolymorpha rutila TaxID=446787 RepID=A0A852Z7W9_9ACTN|nr:hypothetical protein [Actinopolymorpha rutila]NYH89051.1 hypothetical protein [Actinopolymorpha rutila]